jgi:hypothetical protein
LNVQAEQRKSQPSDQGPQQQRQDKSHTASRYAKESG